MPEDPGQTAYDFRHYDEAKAIWESRAQSGDPAALFGLGLMYELGRGVKPDALKSYSLYLEAAKKGFPEAEFNVAVMNDGGRFLPHDAATAAEFYARAAAHGVPRAQFNLAMLYEAGEGVPRNEDAATAWYEAASSDVPEAHRRAALLHARQRREKHPAHSATEAPLTPPTLIEADREGAQTQPPPELVWTAPAQPGAARYCVTVLALTEPAAKPAYGACTARTAMALPSFPAGNYAWRVYVVSSSGHYAASAWQDTKKPA